MSEFHKKLLLDRLARELADAAIERDRAERVWEIVRRDPDASAKQRKAKRFDCFMRRLGFKLALADYWNAKTKRAKGGAV